MESPFRKAQNELIKAKLKSLKGVVVNVGCGKKPMSFASNRDIKIINVDFQKYDCVDICCDICKRIQLPDNYADAVICTNVIEHVKEPFKAIAEIRRIMKKGGILFFIVPFIYLEHKDPADYYRFTRQGIELLLNEFEEKEIIPIGGKFMSLLNYIYFLSPVLFGFICNILYPVAKAMDRTLDKNKDLRATGFFAIATK